MLRNCRECNKVFSHPTIKLCQDCYNKKNEEFKKVKDYIMNNRSASVYEVSTETEVSVERIHEFIKEGRLKIRPADVVLKCSICQSVIESGRVCSECSARLKEEQIQTTPEPEPEVDQKLTGKIHSYNPTRSRRKR